MTCSTRRTKVCFVAIAALLIGTLMVSIPRTGPDAQAILDAIRMVESSGRDDCPDGDGGKAIGPFQIHEPYWRDAVKAQPNLGEGYNYQDCRLRSYAERVVRSYLEHWTPEAWYDGDAEVLARVHNGGPNGHEKDETLGYWAKVRALLED